MRYLATFHTHLSALRTKKNLTGAGVQARLAPAPRALSSSCGTCVLYTAEEPQLACMDMDVERVYSVPGDEEYALIKDYA
jgi:hypothetical protein